MNDHELLELAAKAAGYAVLYTPPSLITGTQWQCFFDGNYQIDWNPLKDDGDALRLEVDANITTKHRFLEILAEENAACNGDYHKARRRAIVRTVAEIGMKMNEH